MRAAVPMAILLAVVAAVLSVMQVRATERRRTESLEAYADLLGRLVLDSLRDAMVSKGRGRLQVRLARIREIEPIVQVRIVDKPGEVVYADDESLVGEVLRRDDPSCASCHRAGQPPNRRSATVRLRDGGREVFRTIRPIRVEAECVRCHDEPAGSVIGVVMTDIDRELLTGALGRQTTASIWALVAASALILAAIALLVRRLVVARLHDLRRILELLRGGARTMPLATAAGDEIDELARATHGLVLDLDERLAVERALHRVGTILERHRAPALILDAGGAILTANRRARVQPGGADADSRAELLARARADGWALADDDEGAGLFALVGAGEAPLGFLELWAPAPDVDQEPDDDAAEPPAEPPEQTAADHELYATVLLQQIQPETPAWRGVLQFDRRLSLARRMIGELADVAAAERAERETLDLASLAQLARGDVAPQVPGVKWHEALDPPQRVTGARHQLRALWVRLARAAAHQAGDGGHVVLFCHRGTRQRAGTMYVGAWSSRPGDGDDTALVDPPDGPPLARAIAAAHGGGLEVAPSYDLTELVALRGLRLPGSGPGALYVAEITGAQSR